MNGGKALAVALSAWLAAVPLAALFLDGAGSGSIVKALFILLGCGVVIFSAAQTYKWPALLGLGVLLVAGSLSIGVDDLTNVYWMLAATGLFIAPAIALAVTLLSMRRSAMPALSDIFKVDSSELTRHYLALGVTLGIMALLIAGMAILWNVPTIRSYLSGQGYVLVQVILFCCVSVILTAPLLGSFSVKRRG
jgi:hypothetical protein